jgi:hypothetical protein
MRQALGLAARQTVLNAYSADELAEYLAEAAEQ